jgi:hypothetical protein
MGASGRVAAVGKTRRPTVGYRQEAADNKPKTSGSPGASPLRATAGPVVLEGFIRKRVQASGRYIVFDFTVPGCCVEFGKPCSECVELGRSEPLNGRLDVIHAAHDLQLTVRPGRAQALACAARVSGLRVITRRMARNGSGRACLRIPIDKTLVLRNAAMAVRKRLIGRELRLTTDINPDMSLCGKPGRKRTPDAPRCENPD